ncbi:hypothetical protein BDV26DRAFT_170758 [Aspergillus bertholletiae]|uniref:Uncharacterized protein n=1 Tax=Aspergillus bertholletiae TaxID=1226010 RepID=A0A5N7BCA0_9EURO|nr:hypothetical protein BDV26DRAFT_170758 [Aspergillus bertholletiae]
MHIQPDFRLSEKQCTLVCQARYGERFTLSHRENVYIFLRYDAVSKAVGETHKCPTVRGYQEKRIIVAGRALFESGPRNDICPPFMAAVQKYSETRACSRRKRPRIIASLAKEGSLKTGWPW